MRQRHAGSVLDDRSLEDGSTDVTASGRLDNSFARLPLPNFKKGKFIVTANVVVQCRAIVETMEFIAVMTGTFFLVPFIKALATKTGEDSYQALRNVIRRQECRLAADKPVRFSDPATGTILVYVPPLPDEAIVKLAAMKPRKIANRVITWDESQMRWEINRRS